MPKFIITAINTKVWQLDTAFNNCQDAETYADKMRHIYHELPDRFIVPDDVDHESIDFCVERIEDDD